MEEWFKLHCLIHFPDDYPTTAPSVGFSTKFPYEAGGSFIEGDRKKVLYGKFNICLNILGNFSVVHPGWEKDGYSGYTSGLDISAVLHQTQTAIIENLERANLHQIESFLEETKIFEARNRDMMDQIEIKYPNETQPALQTTRNRYLSRLQKLSVTVRRPPYRSSSNAISSSSIGGGGTIVASTASSLSPSKLSIANSTSSSKSFNDPVDISDLKIPSNIKLQCTQFLSKLSDQALREDFKSILKQFVADEEIQCWYSKESYVGNILGYGIKWNKKKKSLNTDGSYISLPVFELTKTGSVTKAEKFTHFLPAWINKDHALDSRWLDCMKHSLRELYTDTEDPPICDEIDDEKALCMHVESVYTRFINTLIVQCAEITVKERNTCDVIVHCLINLWRTLYFFVYEYEPTKSILTERMGEVVTDFISTEDRRRKDWCPDIGRLLTQSTLFITTDEKWSEFLDACEHESALRRCLWLQKKEVEMTLNETFEHTYVGRQNILFQVMLKKIVITMDVRSITEEMDQSNCQLPEKVASLMTEWNKARTKMTSDESGWKDYYDLLHIYGLSERVYKEITESDETILKYLSENNERSKTLAGYFHDPTHKSNTNTSVKRARISRDTSSNSNISTENNNGRNGNFRNDSRKHNGKNISNPRSNDEKFAGQQVKGSKKTYSPSHHQTHQYNQSNHKRSTRNRNDGDVSDGNNRKGGSSNRSPNSHSL